MSPAPGSPPSGAPGVVPCPTEKPSSQGTALQWGLAADTAPQGYDEAAEGADRWQGEPRISCAEQGAPRGWQGRGRPRAGGSDWISRPSPHQWMLRARRSAWWAAMPRAPPTSRTAAARAAWRAASAAVGRRSRRPWMTSSRRWCSKSTSILRGLAAPLPSEALERPCAPGHPPVMPRQNGARRVRRREARPWQRRWRRAKATMSWTVEWLVRFAISQCSIVGTSGPRPARRAAPSRVRRRG